MKLRSNKVFLGALLLLLAASCSNESEPQVQIPDPDEGREESVVDISLSFGEVWDIDDDETRAAPPIYVNNTDSYEDIDGITKVRVYTFRRKEGSDGEFYYDKKNEMILPVETKPKKGNDTHSDHNHRIAKGTLTKTYGYEYRVIAIAYPETIDNGFPKVSIKNFPNDANALLDITSETYSDFCAKLNTVDCSDWNDYLTGASLSNNTNHINTKILLTPQMFYGTLHTEYNDSEIIPYAEEDKDGNLNSKAGLKGLLKRGVAKVEIKIPRQNTSHGIQWIAVLAETPNTKVGLTNYDNFLTPSEPLDIKYKDYGDWGKTKNKYTAIAYFYVGGSVGESVDQSFYFYILACKTRLAIRVKTLEAGQLGSTTTQLLNGQLTGDGVEMNDNNGTGIVSPDLIDNEFYFRRNHKYAITISNPINVVEKDKSLN